MESSSRYHYVKKNIKFSLALYALTYIAVFISRTFFVKILGNDYLSLSGLFTNVITIISFSELGLGSASVYCLYKPIAQKNYPKLSAYLSLFKKMYNYVILITLLVGLGLIPSLKFIVNLESAAIPQSGIVSIYVLFVLNSVVSYFLVEYKLLLIADQKNYIASTIQQLFHVFQIVFQIVYLIATKNYLGFLIIQILCTLFTNIFTSIYVKKKYPWMRSRERESIEPSEKKDLYSNVFSIFFYKIGAVVLNGTDNIVISTFIKTTLVGICSNYVLLINAVNSVLMQCFNGIGASIGNHVVLASRPAKECVFRQLDLLCVLIFSFSTICIYSLINPFVCLWLGEEYLLDSYTVASLVGVFYITGVNQIPSLYRTSAGLFKKTRFFPILASVVNVLLSIAFAKIWGLYGVFLATIIARLLFFTMVDSYVVYKNEFKLPVRSYFLKYVRNLMFVIVGIFIAEFVKNNVMRYDIVGVIEKFIAVIVVTSVYLLIVHGFSSDFICLVKRLKKSKV